jgi:hypothetical protein
VLRTAATTWRTTPPSCTTRSVPQLTLSIVRCSNSAQKIGALAWDYGGDSGWFIDAHICEHAKAENIGPTCFAGGCRKKAKRDVAAAAGAAGWVDRSGCVADRKGSLKLPGMETLDGSQFGKVKWVDIVTRYALTAPFDDIVERRGWLTINTARTTAGKPTARRTSPTSASGSTTSSTSSSRRGTRSRPTRRRPASGTFRSAARRSSSRR